MFIWTQLQPILRVSKQEYRLENKLQLPFQHSEVHALNLLFAAF